MTSVAQNEEHRQLGMEPLDHDHGKLEDYIGSLGQVLNREIFKAESVEAAFSELIAHIKDHFNREEAWLKKEEYPGLETHIRQHTTLIKSVQSFRDQFTANPSKDSGQKVYGFVREWLVDHLNSADRVIGGYMSYRKAISKHELTPVHPWEK